MVAGLVDAPRLLGYRRLSVERCRSMRQPRWLEVGWHLYTLPRQEAGEAAHALRSGRSRDLLVHHWIRPLVERVSWAAHPSFAKRVGQLISELPEGEDPNPSYRFYM